MASPSTSLRRTYGSRVGGKPARVAARRRATLLSAPELKGLPFPVVGIGASAGGFESVMALLKHLPANTGMAFVVVLHLDPRHKSKLTELVARATNMPVWEIKNSTWVEPNNVYILPANVDVIIAQKKLKLVRRPESERLHMPIDHFFASLAEEQGRRAIGIVLSGTGSDGTLGLRAIKVESGITLAESEASAKYFGMPGSAIDAGCVDAVLSSDGLAKELVHIGRHPLVRPRHAATTEEEFPETIDALGKIFFLLKQCSGVDFSLYKLSTIKRRISRRMVLQRIERVDKYVILLRSEPDELDALFNDLLINVTAFFRDRAMYSTLKRKIVPRILKAKGRSGEIRVWVPGCATGEEVYSLAICLTEELGRTRRNVRIRVFGTDLSELAISKARTGIFTTSIVKDVSPARLRRFFVRTRDGYQISRIVRDMCTFARQDICEDPPFSRLDLISCRNVLIYLGTEVQKRCMPVFHYALNPGGFLILGGSESTGSADDLFSLIDKKYKIYVRTATVLSPKVEFGARRLASIQTELVNAEPAAAPEGYRDLDLKKQADRMLLTHYFPSGVIVDRHLRVHEFRGRTAAFLEHTPGSANLNLLQMVRPGLIVELRATIQKALKEQAPVRKEGIMLGSDSQLQQVSIEVIPFTVPPSKDTWLLILFEGPMSVGAEPESAETPAAARRGSKTAAERRHPDVARLRAELYATKESLQAIIEEQEATNEELKSANEEIESSNEELQSTNEELETAKEELQSTNEELTTLNDELSNRNLEITRINDDLTNLLNSIRIPILMVDNALAVRRATPLAEKLFNLIGADVGRRLSDFKSNLNLTNLDAMVREVIETLSARETKAQDNSGRWYSLRIHPYRTRDNKIDGAVITLLDVSDEKQTIARLELAAHYNDALLDTIRQPLLVLSKDLRVRKASRCFYETFKLPRKSVENTPLFSLGGGKFNIPQLRRLLAEMLPQSKRLKDFKIEHELPRVGRRALLLNARCVEANGERLILVAMEDISGRDRARDR